MSCVPIKNDARYVRYLVCFDRAGYLRTTSARSPNAHANQIRMREINAAHRMTKSRRQERRYGTRTISNFFPVATWTSLSGMRRAPLCARSQPLSETGPPSSHSRQSVPQTTVFPRREPANIPGHPSGPTFPPSPSHRLDPMFTSANSCVPAARLIAIRSKSEQRNFA